MNSAEIVLSHYPMYLRKYSICPKKYPTYSRIYVGFSREFREVDFSITHSHTQPLQEDEDCSGPLHVGSANVPVLDGKAGQLGRDGGQAGWVNRLGWQGGMASSDPQGGMKGLVSLGGGGPGGFANLAMGLVG